MDKETSDRIKKEAYSKALKFKHTGLDAEAIYARLEKQGIPEEIAKEVAKNVIIHKQEAKASLPPTPLNSFSVFGKIVNTIFPKIKL